jgi:hypothetical protein
MARSTLIRLRDARMQALQIYGRLSTTQRPLFHAPREFFTHVRRFLLRDSDGRSAPSWLRHDDRPCGGKVRAIGCMMIDQ